ncbi:putative inositol oxygenase [Helianthus anomalus]
MVRRVKDRSRWRRFTRSTTLTKHEFVKKMREEYKKLDKVEMSVWECCELLNEVVNDSDPEFDEPQIEHLLQTAEAIWKNYLDKD